MKKILAVILLIASLCLLVSCSSKGTGPDGMKNVAREGDTFDLFVPDEWVAHTDNGVPGASYPDGSNITVLTYMPSESLDPAGYWEKVALPSYQNGVLGDFAVVEDQTADTTLGGKDARRYVFTYTLDGESYEAMQVIAVKDDMVYVFTFTALSSQFEKDRGTANTMCGLFRFR